MVDCKSQLCDQQRAEEIVRRLEGCYPDARCSLGFGSPWELLVSTILSAQCTDERVNAVTPGLFAKYSTVRAFADVPIEELEEAIRSTGFYRNKAKNIQAAARLVISEHGGEVPRTMEELIALPGVARKTANCVLGNAFGLVEGVAVDTHVGRLAQRLALTVFGDPVKIERDLMDVLPRDKWLAANHLLIYHGRAVSQSRKPDCAVCVLLDLCPTGRAATMGAQESGKGQVLLTRN